VDRQLSVQGWAGSCRAPARALHVQNCVEQEFI
jgi:hypothetical protein